MTFDLQLALAGTDVQHVKDANVVLTTHGGERADMTYYDNTHEGFAYLSDFEFRLDLAAWQPGVSFFFWRLFLNRPVSVGAGWVV